MTQIEELVERLKTRISNAHLAFYVNMAENIDLDQAAIDALSTLLRERDEAREGLAFFKQRAAERKDKISTMEYGPGGTKL